jgi:hypothetical protein
MKHILFFDGRKMVFEVQPRSINKLQNKQNRFFKENVFSSLSEQQKHTKKTSKLLTRLKNSHN